MTPTFTSQTIFKKKSVDINRGCKSHQETPKQVVFLQQKSPDLDLLRAVRLLREQNKRSKCR